MSAATRTFTAAAYSRTAPPGSAGPVADAGDRDPAVRLHPQPDQPGADEVALLLGLAVVEDPAEDDPVALAAAVADPGPVAALVVGTGVLGEARRPLAGRWDRQLLSGARRRRAPQQQGRPGQQRPEPPAHGRASGLSRGIEALAMYCSPVVRISDLSLTKSRTATVPSPTLTRVEASQRSTTS